MSRDREDFPCWLVADKVGPLAFDWDEIRMVDVADCGEACLTLSDGTMRFYLVAEPVLDAGQFFRKLAKVLALRVVSVHDKPSTAAK